MKKTHNKNQQKQKVRADRSEKHQEQKKTAEQQLKLNSGYETNIS